MFHPDHILTLQQSLAHYERMLSQSHPTYLTHLRLSASKANAGSAKAIVILSTVSIGVLVVQGVIGALPSFRRSPYSWLIVRTRFQLHERQRACQPKQLQRIRHCDLHLLLGADGVWVLGPLVVAPGEA